MLEWELMKSGNVKEAGRKASVRFGITQVKVFGIVVLHLCEKTERREAYIADSLHNWLHVEVVASLVPLLQLEFQVLSIDSMHLCQFIFIVTSSYFFLDMM